MREREVLSAVVTGGDEQLFGDWKGGKKDADHQGLEKLLVLLVL